MKNVNEKSVESYMKLTEDNILSKRQLEVLTCLKNDLLLATNRMIAKKLNWDINRVTGRVTELRDKGFLVYGGDYYDSATNRTVNLWKCK